ncbi:unnamed protein product [Owenia fusiformis]|uniref:ENTH domain-containing protein n=1 Tax=Owenia fusiformis TaxID=6347 RepID=A0A8S4Q5I1_OWEFU|nr:unnamed protein product [Owenia fusiformis]
MSGQSIMDRVTAAKHSIAGSGLAKSICKATTEEISGPKKKHIDYLLQCTNEPNVSIPQMADLLIERTQDKNWTIVFKALITVHNLMNNGNERFSQYLASNNCRFNLGTFLDKSGVQGYDMSTFIRRYSNYINAKCDSYRAMAFDFCKVKRGKEDGLLRTMSGEKLLKTLPVLQAQVDGLLEFDCSPNELTNGVINASFVLMFKDLIRLFACYNDGIINLLEKYFEMNKKQCKEALDIYKKFLVRMDKVAEFLKVAENVGIDKGEIPDLAKAPASLLEALEQHLSSLEGKKAAKVPTPTQTPANVASAISTYAVQSNSKSATPITDEEKRRVLQEEEKRLEQLKEQRAKEAQASPAPAAAPAPVAAPVAAPATTQPDLFNAPQQNNTASKASDDLLGLNENAFDAKIANVLQLNQQVQQSNQQQAMFGMGQPVASNNPFGAPAMGVGAGQPQVATSSSSAFDANFAAAFGSSAPATGAPGAGGLAGMAPMQPAATPQTGFDGFGDVLQPSNKVAEKPKDQKLLTGDVDSSLSSLVGNLNVNGSGYQVKKQEMQWKPQGEKRMTGGQNFGQQGLAPQTMAPQQPAGAGWGQPQQQAPPMGFQPMGYNNMYNYNAMQGGMQPAGGMGMQPGMGMQQQQFMAGGMRPMGAGMGMQQQPMGNFQPRQQTPNDPFGAL